MTERSSTRSVIAVAGGSGLVGSKLVAILRSAGHEVLVLSRSQGIDLVDGAGLARALRGVEVVVDTISTSETDHAKARGVFRECDDKSADGWAVGRRPTPHCPFDRGRGRVYGNAHYEGKRSQERLVSEGPLPWTILRATQFFEFPEMVMRWTRCDTRVSIAPLLVQPIAASDVATFLLSAAVAPPAQGILEAAGPEKQDFVDMTRRCSSWEEEIRQRRSCRAGMASSVRRWQAMCSCPVPMRRSARRLLRTGSQIFPQSTSKSSIQCPPLASEHCSSIGSGPVDSGRTMLRGDRVNGASVTFKSRGVFGVNRPPCGRRSRIRRPCGSSRVRQRISRSP